MLLYTQSPSNWAKFNEEGIKSMSKVVVEREVPVVAGEPHESTASNFIWAVALIIIVGLVVGSLYYSGFLRRVTQQPTHKVDVTVQQPAPAQ